MGLFKKTLEIKPEEKKDVSLEQRVKDLEDALLAIQAVRRDHSCKLV